ncbi:biotin transporter BioY [Archangium violaceum]|uniref:M56 family metallopeptidase n=1 Tax=Archangium violaceum TaxID=83451 RepID=UPI00193BF373|nr:M56 family metallopeptidase [Archangium violaceum]QRK12173.1 biotin transporter BioY [Archangium violaceum]
MSALEPHAVMELGPGVLRALWQVTWQGALWALAVWALTRALPRLPASVRTTLWWLVGLKCLVGLCAPVAVRLPLLPAPEARVAVVEEVAPAPALAQVGAGERKRGDGPTPGVHAREHAGMRRGWTALVWGALLVWLGGIAWQGRELMRGLAQLRRIRREARPLEDASLHQAAAALGRELGLSRVPRLLVSEHAPSPLALGPLRPEVILPRKALETLSPLEQRMALAHELAHVRRGDLWLGWVPALAQAALFFHPLVRRACREYALAREEACDAAALQATGAAPREYGRLLLIFGVARAPAAAAASGASSHLAALKRRIAMLEHAGTESKHRRWTRWTLGGLALVAIIPFQVVARETPATPPAPPPAAQAPATAARPAEPVKPLVPPAALPALKAPAPAPRVAAAQPAAPAKPPAPPSVIHENEDGRYSYVLLRSEGDAMMSGSTHDLKVARNLAGNGKLPLLYTRRDDGQEFIIRDAATLRAFDDTFKAVRELGAKQNELGEKMGELGGKMGELGGKMGEFGSKMGELGTKRGELGRKQAQLSLKESLLDMEEGEETPDIKRQREQLKREQQELEKQMDELDKQIEPLEQQMEALGDEMEKYSEPMEDFGEEMEKLSEGMEARSQETEKKAQTLLDDAVSKGLAEPVKR